MVVTTPPEYRNEMQVVQRNSKGFIFQYIVELSQERSDQQRRKREARYTTTKKKRKRKPTK